MKRVDDAWKKGSHVKTFLDGIRGGIPLADEQVGVLLRLVGSLERPVKRLLDLGAGNGFLTHAVLSRYPEAHATLVDFSEPMLKEAMKGFASGEANVEIIMADFAFPEWQDRVREHSPFDAVISGYAIHHQPEERKRELFAEIFGLLAPGGIFVNMDHVASRSEWGGTIFNKHCADSLYAFHSGRGTMDSYEEVVEKFHGGSEREADVLSTVEDQCEWLREIGFEKVDCFFKVFELAVFAGLRPND